MKKFLGIFLALFGLFVSSFANEQSSFVGGFKTEAFKASAVFGKTNKAIIFTDNGEGMIDQIQLIGAYDTTGKVKRECWQGYYRTRLRVIVDGEVSVDGTIYNLCGLGSDFNKDSDFENVIFTTPLFSKTGLYSGITFNFKIPYYKSIVIELVRDARDVGKVGLLWGMVKSAKSINIKIGDITLPKGAKFHAITCKQNCKKGDQLEIFSTQKAGVLAGINMSGQGSKFDWVEGCLRAFVGNDNANCIMLSSGLEDYLGGAFGYNVGVRQFNSWGCTYKQMKKAPFTLCGYRNHFNDSVCWRKGGFKVSLRWGDQNKHHWNLNSTDNFAGQKNDPGEGTLVATAFYYDWE